MKKIIAFYLFFIICLIFNISDNKNAFAMKSDRDISAEKIQKAFRNYRKRNSDKYIVQNINQSIKELKSNLHCQTEYKPNGKVDKTVDKVDDELSLRFPSAEGTDDFGIYIYPNESYPSNFNKYYKSLAPGGTLISVGTLRSWINIAYGNFSEAVLFDYNRSAVDFNLIHLDLLKGLGQLGLSSHRQRYQYFAALHCQWLNADQLKQIEVFDPNHDAYGATFLELFEKLTNVSTQASCDVKKFPEPLRSVMHKLSELTLSDGKYQVKALEKEQDFHFMKTQRPRSFFGAYYYSRDFDLTSMNLEHYRLGTREPLFWENDVQWNKLQNFISGKNKIMVVNGDIFGKNTLSSIGKYLSQRGKKVTAIDISNILDYPKRAIEESVEDYKKSEIKENYLEFAKNIEKLPLDQNAVILLTSAETRVRQNEFDWYYFSLGAIDYLKNPSLQKIFSDAVNVP